MSIIFTLALYYCNLNGYLITENGPSEDDLCIPSQDSWTVLSAGHWRHKTVLLFERFIVLHVVCLVNVLFTSNSKPLLFVPL